MSTPAPSVAVPVGAIPGGRAYAGSELMSAAPPHRLLPALVAAAAVAVVAGCGPGAILTAESPDQAVSAALQAAQTTSLRMSLSGDLHLDTASLTNLPASIQSVLGQVGSGGSATGSLDAGERCAPPAHDQRRRAQPGPRPVRRPHLRQPGRRRLRAAPADHRLQPRGRSVGDRHRRGRAGLPGSGSRHRGRRRARSATPPPSPWRPWRSSPRT